MAKVKFPLEMANGVQVRTIEELKDNFDINKVVGCFLEGKLQTWLTDRYYDEEAEQIADLKSDDTELTKKLSEIFGIEYADSEEVDVDKIVSDNERIAKIKQFTDDENIIKNYDKVAFTQEELADLYDAGIQTIYLCEGEFKIPKAKQDLKYVVFGGAKTNIRVDKSENAKDEGCSKFSDVIPIVFEPYSKEHCFDFGDEENILSDDGRTVFFYKGGNIYKRTSEKTVEILQQYIFNYQKIIAVGNYIFFTHMVGNGRGDHLKVYLIDNDVYMEIDNFVSEFIIDNGLLYYIKASDYYATSHRKAMRCKLDLTGKEEIYDFGKTNKAVRNLKVKDNKLYYDTKQAGVFGQFESSKQEFIII